MPTIVHFEVVFRADAENPTAVLRDVLRQTVTFPGFIDVKVLVDDADARKVVSVITWDRAESYDTYVAWRQTPAGATQLSSVLAAPPTIRRFSTSIAL